MGQLDRANSDFLLVGGGTFGGPLETPSEGSASVLLPHIPTRWALGVYFNLVTAVASCFLLISSADVLVLFHGEEEQVTRWKLLVFNYRCLALCFTGKIR